MRNAGGFILSDRKWPQRDSRHGRSLHRVCDLRRRFDLYCGRDLHCGRDSCCGVICVVDATCTVDGVRYETTWVIGAISILLKTTLECGLFCVKDIE